MVSELRLRSSLFASAAFSLTDTMAEAGAASAEAETRAKSIQEKAMLFAKDGMVPPARNRDELCKAMNPCAEVVQQFGLTPEAGVEVMYRVLAALEVERDGPLPASDVVALVNHAIRRAKDQPGATGTDGVGMATDEEREQALQSAFTDSDRVLAILTAAAAVEYKNVAAAAALVRKSGGTKLGAKSTAAADIEMHGTESGQQDENVRQTEKEPQTEVEKPNDESDTDSETEGHLLARLAVVFKDKPRAFSAAVRRQFGGTTKGQEQPKSKDEKGHGRSQANQVSRGRGNRFQRFTPYGAGGRGFGRGFASNNAVQALPPQEVQFNYAQADYGYNNNVEAPPQQYGAPRHCYNCGGIGHYAAACRGQGQNPARGRGPSRVSLYSDAFGTHAGQRLERLFGCKPDRHEALSCDHDECAERDSGSDEFEYVAKRKRK